MKLIILRGLSGGGKSTMARILKAHYESEGHKVLHVEADQFFHGPNGYEFRGGDLPKAHAGCYERAKQGLRDGKIVIVANTNVKRAHFAPYVALARELGVPYQIITLEPVGMDPEVLARRNEHSVTLFGVQRQFDQWEPTGKTEDAILKPVDQS